MSALSPLTDGDELLAQLTRWRDSDGNFGVLLLTGGVALARRAWPQRRAQRPRAPDGPPAFCMSTMTEMQGRRSMRWRRGVPDGLS
jgi:hypothetical protein